MSKLTTLNLDDDIINPFEVHDNFELLRNSLDEIDKRNIRSRYKTTEDPINLAFESIDQTSLSTLTKDFIREGVIDFISFISRICK